MCIIAPMMPNSDDSCLKNSTQPSVLGSIRQLVKADFEQVNSMILSHLDVGIPQIKEVAQHIIDSGGKRLRPLLTLLGAKIVACVGDAPIKLATVIEYIHTATLLHDDVIDMSSLRRGHPTANAIWGDSSSILVGDFLYSRALQILTYVGNMGVIQTIADTTNTISQGEVLQLINRHNPDVSEAHYFKVIQHKTAVLFAAATQLSAIIMQRPAVEIQALYDYGLNLGMAFQMIDDWLDYAVSSAESGKNLGDDLSEGKATLPLIYAMQHGTKAEAELIRRTIRQGGLEDFNAILEIIRTTNAFAYIYTQAEQFIKKAKAALAIFPFSHYVQALSDLAEFAVSRRA